MKEEIEKTEIKEETRTVTIVECDLCGQRVEDSESDDFALFKPIESATVWKVDSTGQNKSKLDSLEPGESYSVRPQDIKGYYYEFQVSGDEDRKQESIDLCVYCQKSMDLVE